MDRPDLISTFTKIELWRQTQYKRIVYLDADMVCLRAPNELLRLDTAFAAAPDIGWPDCFNSGMMVLNPNMGDYYALLALAQRGISFDGADQGLLNMHFRDWERVSFAYNCTPSGNYQYVPAYRHFQSSISAVHFIGKDKPWTLGRENKHNSGVYGELLGRWWAVYDAHYRSQTSAYYSGQSLTAAKKVQDYVRGEEALFVPGYSSVSAPPQQHYQPSTHQNNPPEIVVQPPAEAVRRESLTEQPMGDVPDASEKAAENDFTPTPTVVQRKFSAPQVDWEPAK
jgi:glycogenin